MILLPDLQGTAQGKRALKKHKKKGPGLRATLTRRSGRYSQMFNPGPISVKKEVPVAYAR